MPTTAIHCLPSSRTTSTRRSRKLTSGARSASPSARTATPPGTGAFSLREIKPCWACARTGKPMLTAAAARPARKTSRRLNMALTGTGSPVR
ncbi:hypothetical protein G6F57_020460 [Rhizopus arrhizus]|nr:hypothetical protein G6F57_020460 [Rhizopus arrhizus]KAG1581633.1 hypothetical protein G6F46_015334 [Rhizopus delemar]